MGCFIFLSCVLLVIIMSLDACLVYNNIFVCNIRLRGWVISLFCKQSFLHLASVNNKMSMKKLVQ